MPMSLSTTTNSKNPLKGAVEIIPVRVCGLTRLRHVGCGCGQS